MFINVPILEQKLSAVDNFVVVFMAKFNKFVSLFSIQFWRNSLFEHSKISLSVSDIAEFEFVSSGYCLLFSLIFPDEFWLEIVVYARHHM